MGTRTSLHRGSLVRLLRRGQARRTLHLTTGRGAAIDRAERSGHVRRPRHVVHGRQRWHGYRQSVGDRPHGRPDRRPEVCGVVGLGAQRNERQDAPATLHRPDGESMDHLGESRDALRASRAMGAWPGAGSRGGARVPPARRQRLPHLLDARFMVEGVRAWPAPPSPSARRPAECRELGKIRARVSGKRRSVRRRPCELHNVPRRIAGLDGVSLQEDRCTGLGSGHQGPAVQLVGERNTRVWPTGAQRRPTSTAGRGVPFAFFGNPDRHRSAARNLTQRTPIRVPCVSDPIAFSVAGQTRHTCHSTSYPACRRLPR